MTIKCPYLYITSAKEYDLYQRMCIEQLPYSVEYLKEMIGNSENIGDLLSDAVKDYNLEWLNTQQNR